jgi:hypothetical protein
MRRTAPGMARAMASCWAGAQVFAAGEDQRGAGDHGQHGGGIGPVQLCVDLGGELRGAAALDHAQHRLKQRAAHHRRMHHGRGPLGARV